MIITFANQKGGVGKTTLSLSFAWQLVLNKERTILIDSDPQGSILSWSDNREEDLPTDLTIVALAKKTIHRDIKSLVGDYSHVIIDSPPRSTDITRSAILAADLVVIPCTPSPYDVWASMETVEIIKEAKIYNENMKCVFVINRKITNTAIGRDVVEAIKNLAPDITVMKSEICQRVIYAECSNGFSIQEKDREGKAINEIKEFYEEIMEMY